MRRRGGVHRARNLRPPACDDITTAPISGPAAARMRRHKVLGGLIHEYDGQYDRRQPSHNVAGQRPQQGNGTLQAVPLSHGMPVPPAPGCSGPLADSWHMQDEGVIDCPQILWIGGDDMETALPCADRNRDIDHIGVA